MASSIQKTGGKQGKKNPLLFARRKNIKTKWEAHRLEGAVKNRGIKNVGRQKLKPAQAE